MGQPTWGWARPPAPNLGGRSGSNRNTLLDVLTGLLGPAAAATEVDGPARMELAAPDAELVGRLLDQTQGGGVRLAGEGGLLEQLAGRVLESLVPRDERIHPRETSYPAIFLDAIHVKTITGRGTNRSVYVAVTVEASGRRDVVGLCTTRWG
jgi:Transposase, Mutator family